MDGRKPEEDHENAKVRKREKEDNAGRCAAVAPPPVLLLFPPLLSRFRPFVFS